jgi:hypothetical protein
VKTLRDFGLTLLALFWLYQTILGLNWTVQAAIALDWWRSIGSLSVCAAYVVAIIAVVGFMRRREEE